MSGKAGRSGRKTDIGTVYRFEVYYRFIPGVDPTELKDLFEQIILAKGRKRRDIIQSALLGGAQQAHATAISSEDSQMTHLLDEMFENF